MSAPLKSRHPRPFGWEYTGHSLLAKMGITGTLSSDLSGNNWDTFQILIWGLQLDVTDWARLPSTEYVPVVFTQPLLTCTLF